MYFTFTAERHKLAADGVKQVPQLQQGLERAHDASAAVDGDALTTDKGGVLRGQKGYHFGHLVHPTHPSERMCPSATLNVTFDGLAAHASPFKHFGALDDAGIDRVDPDQTGFLCVAASSSFTN